MAICPGHNADRNHGNGVIRNNNLYFGGGAMNYCGIDRTCHAVRYKSQGECDFGDCKVFRKEPWCAYKTCDGMCGNRKALLDALERSENNVSIPNTN